jgi:hypothetical protein
MILGGVCHAGRFDGVSDVHFQDFLDHKQLFEIRDNKIFNLAQGVKEKCVKVWHAHLLCFNDHSPKMCCLRHLLVFLHCANLDGKGGCGFTDKEEANSCTPSQAWGHHRLVHHKVNIFHVANSGNLVENGVGLFQTQVAHSVTLMQSLRERRPGRHSLRRVPSQNLICC